MGEVTIIGTAEGILFEAPSPMPGPEVEEPEQSPEQRVHQMALLPKASSQDSSRQRRARADSIEALYEMGLPTPVEFMVGVYCDANLPRQERMDAAKAAAPFLHHKLSAVEMKASVNISHEDALDALDGEFSEQ